MPANADLDSVVRVLQTYPGRDKAIRSLAFWLQLKAQGSDKKDAIIALAKQLSACRLVLRQFNHPAMIKACQSILNANPTDKVDYACNATVTGVYTVYGVVELCAWLTDAKLLNFDSAKLWRWCLYLWITAMSAGIIRLIHLIRKKNNLEKSREDIISLVGLSSDFISAIHSLPHKILWAGKLTPRQSAGFSLIASLIGLYKVF